MIEIYAHRGANREAPENSLLAFQKALDIGVDGIELDVVMTKDLVPVVTHDPGTIHQKNFAEVRHLPTLTQVLELLSPTPCKVILDLKKQPGMARAVGSWIGGMGLDLIPLSRLIVSSFYPTYLWATHKFHPQIPLAWILDKNAFTLVPLALSGKLLKVCALHPARSLVTPQLVAAAHSLRWPVRSWVVNQPKEVAQAVALGVDGIFTDDPRGVKKMLQGV